MTASSRLQGLVLDGGWTVIEALAQQPRGTGGTFSHSYLAERDSKRAFVKAFDFSEAFEPDANTLDILAILTASYESERDILEHCAGRRMSRVSLALGSGHTNVPGMSAMEGRVFYLIFELADGDVRCQMDEARAQDALWCLKALRDVALGLWQCHRDMIAHQDAKPSNVLVFGDDLFKLADFGRSSRKGHTIWYDENRVAGDRTYAPLELLYGFTHPDFVVRRVGADLYLLGNLAAFLFTGVNVTSAILSNLDPQFHWTRWGGSYEEVLPYVQEAFDRFLESFGPKIPADARPIYEIAKALCNPDVLRRGHPKSVRTAGQYTLERHVSELTRHVMELKVDLRIRAQRTA